MAFFLFFICVQFASGMDFVSVFFNDDVTIFAALKCSYFEILPISLMKMVAFSISFSIFFKS